MAELKIIPGDGMVRLTLRDDRGGEASVSLDHNRVAEIMGSIARGLHALPSCKDAPPQSDWTYVFRDRA